MLIEILIRYRRLWFILLLIASIFFFIGLSSLRIDFSFDSFYAKESSDVQYYQQYKQYFEESSNYMVYVALQSPEKDVFDIEFLRKADSVFNQLANIGGLDSSIYATQAEQIRRTGLGFNTRKYFDFTDQQSIQRSRERVEEDKDLTSAFITRDQRYVCGYFMIKDSLFDTPERDKIVNEAIDILNSSSLEHIISGIPHIRTQYVKKIGEELISFLSMSVILVVLVLFLLYRNVWNVLIPIVAVFLSLAWLTGLMGATGEPLTLLSNLLLPIMFVVGMSDVIHIISKYIFELRSGKAPSDAMRITLKEIGFAVFLTSVTTAIGFASLSVSEVPPIRRFGIYAAIGVLFTYLISIIIIPNALLIIKKERLLRSRAVSNLRSWDRWLLGIDRITIDKTRWVLSIFGFLLISSFYLISEIPLNTFLLEDIGPNDPIRKSMEFFEEQSYGLRSFEIGIHVKEGESLTDPELLHDMEAIQNYLSTQASFSPFISLATWVKQANYIQNFRRERYRKIPDTQDQVEELLLLAETHGGDQFMKQLYVPEEGLARINARLSDIGTDSLEIIFNNLDEFIATECDTARFEYRYTGSAFLTERNLIYLRRSLLWGLIVAFITIGIIMGLLFGSFKMLMISMIPNTIPLIFTGGIMGLFSIPLNASTAIIFVISFGIAVDDTIHALTRYRLERKLGRSVNTAVRHMVVGTGKAMIMTSMVLIAGFVLLLTSDFGGTLATGLFTALTILFALLADLFLLPILLRYFYKEETRNLSQTHV